MAMLGANLVACLLPETNCRPAWGAIYNDEDRSRYIPSPAVIESSRSSREPAASIDDEDKAPDPACPRFQLTFDNRLFLVRYRWLVEALNKKQDPAPYLRHRFTGFLIGKDTKLCDIVLPGLRWCQRIAKQLHDWDSDGLIDLLSSAMLIIEPESRRSARTCWEHASELSRNRFVTPTQASYDASDLFKRKVGRNNVFPCPEL